MRSPLLPLGGSRRFLSTTEAAMKIIPCASLYSLCRTLISLFTAKVHSFYFRSGIVHVSLISIYYGFPPPSDSVFFLPPGPTTSHFGPLSSQSFLDSSRQLISAKRKLFNKNTLCTCPVPSSRKTQFAPSW